MSDDPLQRAKDFVADYRSEHSNRRWREESLVADFARTEIARERAEIVALAAELKEYREFVGAIKQCSVLVNNTRWKIETHHRGAFAYNDPRINVIDGTDPFDAWRKLRENA